MGVLLSRFKIGARLGLGFAAVLVLTLVVGVFAINRLGQVNDATADLATNWLPAVRALGEYRAALAEERRGETAWLMADQPAVVDAERRLIETARRDAAQAWKAYAATLNSGEEERYARDIQQAQQRYDASLDRLLALAHGETGFLDRARELSLKDSGAAFEAAMQALRRDVDFQTRGGDAAYRGAEDAYQHTRHAVILLLVAAIAAGALLAATITRSITVPIGQALVVAETVAAGDLSSRIVETGRRDETGQLLAALARMNASLVRIVSEVRQGADSIATGSVEIAKGNADLSQRTEEQASSLEQTAASMEQLTATVRQNSDIATQATQLAGDASQAASQGGRVVGEVVATMDAIAEASRRIADIIGTIDGIAFQTNILALNAAVEAARAGEQGRGFAVVAGEVRGLAQRAAQAAREIKALIGESVGRVEGGTRLVGEAGSSMQDIVTRVQRVNELIHAISAASREQSTGIDQIGDAVSQLDQVTQQNAALVEQSAAAAESLKQQAAALAQAVALFRL